MKNKQPIQLFVISPTQIGVRSTGNNLFVKEAVKQIPFSSFDSKRGAWKIPVWALPEFIETLRIRPNTLPQDVLDAYKTALEIEKKTVIVYFNGITGLISLTCRKDAYRNVKNVVRKCSGKNHGLIYSYGKFLEIAQKNKVLVRASKEAYKLLNPEKYAEKFVPSVKSFFPDFPHSNLIVTDVAYVKQTATCDICKGRSTKFFLIKDKNSGTIARACPLCSAVILDPKTFAKWKKEMDKVTLKNSVKRAKLHKGFFFRVFKANPIERNRFPKRQRDLNKIRAEVSNILQEYEEKVAKSKGRQEGNEDNDREVR
ncbi:MAG: hypothetical protein J7L03_00305 [Caldisericaceae bacterium]|nr:hypothetical protein [Caldisericaceae bacterium]